MPDQSGAWRRWLALGVLALGVCLLDDNAPIGLNPTIRRPGARLDGAPQ